jgi:hypothetical protein
VDTTFRVLDGIGACCVVGDALVLHRVRPGSITQQLHSGELKRLEEMGIDPNG